MRIKLMTLLDKYLDALPITGAVVGVTVLACVFSGSLRDLLLRADLDMLAGAVALLPLSAVLLALSISMRPSAARIRQKAEREKAAARRKAMLYATYDVDQRDA